MCSTALNSCLNIRLLTNLRRLNLFGNRLSQTAIIEISKWLPQLQELDLSSNDLEQLPEEIRLLTNLRRLNLFGNRLSQTAIIDITRWLPQLQELNLSFNDLEQLPEDIRLLTNLRRLNLLAIDFHRLHLSTSVDGCLNCRSSI